MGNPDASGHRLVSADSHVNEPPDLWTSRVPEKFRDRAPRIEHLEQGDAWILEGVDDPISFGLNACAGLPPDEVREWVRFEELRPGGYDPAERLREMDIDGVDAEVLYPTPRLAQAVIANTDTDFHVACVRAYNDWLAAYAGHDAARFAGLAMLPNRGADHAVAEIERMWGQPGIGGFMMGCYPNGTLEVLPEDDAVWAALVERGASLNIHVSLNEAMPKAHRSPLPGYGRFFDAPGRIVQLMFAGVFDRYPDLNLVIAEVDCGWVPYFKEQLDNNFLQLRGSRDFTIEHLPSEYVARNVHFAYINDPVGVDLLDRIGIDQVLWSSDYPHISADWPRSWRSIGTSLSSLTVSDRHQLLAGNADRLYSFG